mmetsp:Transcript_7550/g.6683  ORF Transcript_7550/g.6683 Transcript_7550/m.6683 type:complete len:134 (-) Transcript_7550:293-694(-)
MSISLIINLRKFNKIREGSQEEETKANGINKHFFMKNINQIQSKSNQNLTGVEKKYRIRRKIKVSYTERNKTIEIKKSKIIKNEEKKEGNKNKVLKTPKKLQKLNLSPISNKSQKIDTLPQKSPKPKIEKGKK